MLVLEASWFPVTAGADIDTLLVAPRHVDRADFFSSFHKMLMSEKGVVNVRAIPDAFVPVIKMEYEGIEVGSFLHFFFFYLTHLFLVRIYI